MVTKVRIIGIALLLGSLLSVFLTMQLPAPQETNAPEVATAQGEAQAQRTSEPTRIEQRSWYRIVHVFGTGLSTQLLVLGLVLGAFLLVRGSADWVEKGLATYAGGAVFGFLLSIPGLLAMFATTTVSTAFILLVLLAAIGRVALALWCHSVVRDDLHGRRVRPAPEDRVAERLPAYMRDRRTRRGAATHPTGAASSAPIVPVTPQVPEALLYMQGTLDLTGFGAWLQSRGECDITLTPAPTPGAEVLAADQAGSWYPLGTTDATGRLALQLPAGSWYLLVRSPNGTGTATIATVTGQRAGTWTAAAMPAAA